ncbi:T9SS type A sorting domain-containing protein [Algoriphagus sp.]|uniref:T9SS type A sorting domain-containing protein n=1 Tax=Algoriphagus sp. TaxID=1872435 RepID=UPI0025EA99C2|nr:T9SS type A sorting domain-containing protein [Algoriphagus sp.]
MRSGRSFIILVLIGFMTLTSSGQSEEIQETFIQTLNFSKNAIEENSEIKENSIQQGEDIDKEIKTPIRKKLADLPTLYGECSLVVPSPTIPNENGRSLVATTSDDIFYSKQGTFTLTWQYDLGDGNFLEQEQEIVIKDVSALAPEVSNLPLIKGDCMVTVTPPAAFDNCKGRILAKTNDPLIYDQPGQYSILWIYEDGNGNATYQEQSILVQDLIAPSISPPTDLTVRINENEQFLVLEDLGIASGSDNCSEVLISNNAPSFFEIGTTEVIWTSTDNNGNSSQAIQKITVIPSSLENNQESNRLSFQKELKVGEFHLFPNPASSVSNIYVGIDREAEVKIEVFDSAGRLVYEHSLQKSNTFEYQIPVNELSAGVYQVQVSVGDQIMSKRLIKK